MECGPPLALPPLPPAPTLPAAPASPAAPATADAAMEVDLAETVVVPLAWVAEAKVGARDAAAKAVETELLMGVIAICCAAPVER